MSEDKRYAKISSGQYLRALKSNARLRQQLEIATKALEEIERSRNWATDGHHRDAMHKWSIQSVAIKALTEIKELQND